MQYQYHVHDQETAYRGFFKFNRYRISFDSFGGGQIENVIRECGVKHDIVAVLPYDPVAEVFLMVEQFRIGMMVRGEHAWTHEIVAGFMDVVGETQLQTAERELFEETGCRAKSLHPMISYYPGPGGSAAKIHVFVAVVDSAEAVDHTGIAEEGEDIRVQKIPLATAKENLLNGTLDNATSLIAFQQFFMHHWLDKLHSKK